jgi:hypothetical protein
MAAETGFSHTTIRRMWAAGGLQPHRVGRRRAQRPLYHGRNLIVVDGSRPARTSLVEQAIAAILQEAATPFANRMFVQAKLGCDGLVGQSARTSQNDAAPLDSDRATRCRRTCRSRCGRRLGNLD